MRKADYAALAAIIRAQIQWSEANMSDDHAHGAVCALETTARQFAATASVNRAEFLRACGIEP